MKIYEITTYTNSDNYGNNIFGYTFRNTKTDNYIYTNGKFENVLLYAKGFANGKGQHLEDICTIR